ncbi:GNAT family N-acetyltransferase [Pontibacter liquoris]|uniref:GNAT family N-acetyltransferase n=1 Tax=Pontibacter liquoris TaxID=2905677 RepID=UPI001FA7CE55|nr:GNAT family N-acetyltransferase [Pontibacter liquoris]
MQIKEITAAQTWPVRHTVMWPGKEVDYVKLPDDAAGLHYGLFAEGELVSVISLFITGETAQFRKFATHTTCQGKGYGTALLQHLVGQAAEQGVTKLWCNARAEKAGFYEQFGLQETPNRFVKGAVAYVVMEMELRMNTS